MYFLEDEHFLFSFAHEGNGGKIYMYIYILHFLIFHFLITKKIIKKGEERTINHFWILNGDDKLVFYSFHTNLLKVFIENHS